MEIFCSIVRSTRSSINDTNAVVVGEQFSLFAKNHVMFNWIEAAAPVVLLDNQDATSLNRTPSYLPSLTSLVAGALVVPTGSSQDLTTVGDTKGFNGRPNSCSLDSTLIHTVGQDVLEIQDTPFPKYICNPMYLHGLPPIIVPELFALIFLVGLNAEKGSPKILRDFYEAYIAPQQRTCQPVGSLGVSK